MTEPCSTGIGGDMFILFWDAKTKKVHAMNGSGRSAAKSDLDAVRRELGLRDGEASYMPDLSIHAVTVPGAAAGWVDTRERFGSGKVSMGEILAPAIQLGEKGFPVSEVAGYLVSHFQRQRSIAQVIIETDRLLPVGTIGEVVAQCLAQFCRNVQKGRRGRGRRATTQTR